METPALTSLVRLHCPAGTKVEDWPAGRELVGLKAATALGPVFCSAMIRRMAVFTLNDPTAFAFSAALKEHGVEFRETSQTGDDVTIYIQGHPRFERAG